MAHRRVSWTLRAVKEIENILSFWYFHNRSGAYSQKLNKAINSLIFLIAEQPSIGKVLDDKQQILYITYRSYRIIYSYTSEDLIIISIWDTRRNPKKFKI